MGSKFLTGIVHWINSNHDTIVAISAFGGLVFSAILTWSTVQLWKETRRLARGAETQSVDMKASISEASRSADAMGNVAKSITTSTMITSRMAEDQRTFWKTQMRAYIAVSHFCAIPQNIETKYRTEVRLTLTNSGNTPAHNVFHNSNIALLRHPLDKDFNFKNHQGLQASIGVINTGQNWIIKLVLNSLVTESEVLEYTTGNTLKIYVWGIINYVDAFAEPHVVRYSQWVDWLVVGTMGVNTTLHNNSN